MAKISARGATEVARVNFTFEVPDHNGEPFTATGILLCRSDGKILQRNTKPYPSGYTIVGKLRDSYVPGKGTGTMQMILASYARRKGYSVKY